MKRVQVCRRSSSLLLLGFVAGGLVAGAAYELQRGALPAALAGDRLASLSAIERGTVEVFQRASPAVVNVSNIALRRNLFDRDVMAIPQGSGTGFVWDDQGHIVTNYHVVHQANAVTVTFADQTTRRAEVVGEYPDKDLAVLKIGLSGSRPGTGKNNPAKLTPLEVGTSRDLMVGQSVLAIGNPFGLDHTLTTGVVSALGREIKSLTGRPIQDMIQTDASINSGNSGGPLLDSAGRLIGVNTAIFSPSGTSAGIGFAIPVDTVKSVVSQLIEHGRVVRPALGVQLFPDEVARRLGMEGVLIDRVMPRSAAARAGLKGTVQLEDGFIPGDVITGIDGKKVRTSEDIYRILDRRQVGDTVEVTFERDSREQKARLRLQSMEDR